MSDQLLDGNPLSPLQHRIVSVLGSTVDARTAPSIRQNLDNDPVSQRNVDLGLDDLRRRHLVMRTGPTHGPYEYRLASQVDALQLVAASRALYGPTT